MGEITSLLPGGFGDQTPIGLANSLDGRADGVVPALLQSRRERRRGVIGLDRARESGRSSFLRERRSNELGGAAEPVLCQRAA